MAVFDNGALSLIERGASGCAGAFRPRGPRTLQATHSAAIGRSGALIVTASSDSDVAVIECRLPAGPQASRDCREFDAGERSRQGSRHQAGRDALRGRR